MSVTINVLRRTSQKPITFNPTPEQINPITYDYVGTGIKGDMRFHKDSDGWIDAKTGKPIKEIKDAIENLESQEPQEIKDIVLENQGSDSISELTDMKYRRKNKK
jgi:hypothetical protein